jgi:hypothetical protein
MAAEHEISEIVSRYGGVRTEQVEQGQPIPTLMSPRVGMRFCRKVLQGAPKKSLEGQVPK